MKPLHKKLFDEKSGTSFRDCGHIRLTWPLFDIILFSTRERDEILYREMQFHVTVDCLDMTTKTSKVLH